MLEEGEKVPIFHERLSSIFTLFKNQGNYKSYSVKKVKRAPVILGMQTNFPFWGCSKPATMETTKQ
jgi:hypothetical protein